MATPDYLKITPLELMAMLPVVVLILFLANQHQQRRIKTNPEYRFYTRGLVAKLIGGQVFALLYLMVYSGGDTINYFGSAVALSRVITQDFGNFITLMVSDPTPEAYSLFNPDTGYIHSFIYWDHRTLRVVKLICPIVFLTGKSFLLSTLLVSALSYFGTWKLFRLLVEYFPRLQLRLAIAVLFVPSVLFWGSGLMKDTFTLSATCLIIYLLHRILIKGLFKIQYILMLLIASMVVIFIKPYIFMILMPVSLTWVFMERLARLKSKFASTLLLPVSLVIAIGGSFFVLSQLGDALDKFSVDQALNTAVVTQSDLKAERYSKNSFDVGSFDASVTGVISKFPAASTAGLFRPFLWESTNVTMVISGIENLLLLIFTVYLLVKGWFLEFFRVIIKSPILLFAIVFSISFAFVVGLTTSNFGALVRFKIPLLPLFVAALFVIDHKLTQKVRGVRSIAPQAA